MKVFTAHVVTESSDHYTWVYQNEPSREKVIADLFEWEGEIEDLEWYDKTTSVTICETEVRV